MVAISQSANWSASQKIAFRFCFVFFVLYMVFVPSDSLPLYGNIFYPFINYFQGFIIWAAKGMFHITVTPVTRSLGDSGGDATFDYLLYLFVIVLSAAATVIWSYTGRKTPNYNNWFYWLVVILRYFVATTMMLFGASKVFRVQFPAPTIGRLMERVGDMSPMGLAWTYMGYSHWYNYFTGFAELLCAGLLFYRRTTRIGATVGVVLLVNIVAINFCFDVCVKLSSATLLLTCFFILIPEHKRFISFFFRDGPIPASDSNSYRFKKKWKTNAVICIKYTFILCTCYWNYDLMQDQIRIYGYGGNDAKRPPLYGLYQVEDFVLNGDTLKPLTTDTTRWNKFWISRPGFAATKLMNDSIKGYHFKPDTIKHIIAASTYADTVHKFYLHYVVQKSNVITLQGLWKNEPVFIRMHKVDLNRFRLVSRGFHMVNEFPYNW